MGRWWLSCPVRFLQSVPYLLLVAKLGQRWQRGPQWDDWGRYATLLRWCVFVSPGLRQGKKVETVQC